MANVYEAFSLNDRTLTGKVLGDFTIDFCKTLDGTDVSQTGMTLTELGVGKYVLYLPNLTERTVVSLYLTSDSTKSASIMMDPIDGDVASETTLIAMGTAPEISHIFTQGEKITIARGDTVNVPFSLGALHDCTGKLLYFAVKEKLSDAAPLFEVLCVLSNEASCIGYVPLTPTETDTAVSGIYEFERVDDVNDTNPHTITQGRFVIVEDVRH